MTAWTQLLIGPTATLRRAIETIDAGGMQIAFVVGADNRLLGTVSDGDMRGAILKNVDLNVPVTQIMNQRPLVIRPEDDRESVLIAMQARRIYRVPVVDSDGHMIGLEVFDELMCPARRDNLVVLMAGGRGTRLYPLTTECPKPMLPVAGKPILETILLNFIAYGFHRFYLSVNYKADVVKDHFGDGSKWKVSIRYLEESEAMGTSGSLSLLPETPVEPLVVMNGDLLSTINLHLLLDFHQQHRASATMCVREYDFQVPYGVVQLEGQRLVGIEEKPVHRFFVSAGIYVLEPAALQLLPHGAPFDMPDFFAALLRHNMQTMVFPIREYWLDVGRHADLERANNDFASWSR